MIAKCAFFKSLSPFSLGNLYGSWFSQLQEGKGKQRHQKAKSARALWKLLRRCLSFKKKKRAHLVPPFLYPFGFFPKMKKLQQTFLEILLMQENLGYKPLKSLSHDQVFNAIVLKSLVIHKQAIRFSPTSFFSSTHSPHPQSSRTLRVSPL